MATRLCSVVIDCADPAALGRWWSSALGWPVTYEAVDEVDVEPAGNDGAVPALVFGSVPEPKTVKNRVHLDLASESEAHQVAQVERLLALGATRADAGQHDVPWVVLADPEGNELCVLEPRDRYQDCGPLAAIVLDAADPPALARFWEHAAGWHVGFEGGGGVSLHHPSDRPPDLDIVVVSDPRRVKNRVHLDVAPFPGDDLDAEVARLVALGARRVDIGQGDVSWVVLADPEGNELCVLSPR